MMAAAVALNHELPLHSMDTPPLVMVEEGKDTKPDLLEPPRSPRSGLTLQRLSPASHAATLASAVPMPGLGLFVPARYIPGDPHPSVPSHCGDSPRAPRGKMPACSAECRVWTSPRTGPLPVYPLECKDLPYSPYSPKHRRCDLDNACGRGCHQKLPYPVILGWK